MFTAYIPIKLNSERIENKNFLNINEKPLFVYVIENLLVCESRRYKQFPAGMQKENVEVNPYNKLLVHNINQEDRQKFAKLAQEKYPEVINRFINKL